MSETEDNRVHEDAHEAFVEGEHPIAEEVVEKIDETAEKLPPEE